MKHLLLRATSILLWATLVASAQQNPNGVLPLNSTDQPYLFLVRDPVLQADLQLQPEQAAGLKALNDELDGPLWSMRNRSPQQIVATMQKATERTRNELARLLTQEQIQRIQQVEWWVRGMKSVLLEEVATKLDLSSQQQTEITRIVRDTQTAMAELQTKLQEGGDAKALNKQYGQLQVDEQQSILALMSEEQKQQWIAMLGRRIDTNRLGRIKFKAPELHAKAGWVNSEPLTLEKLKGKVVALHFYAFA